MDSPVSSRYSLERKPLRDWLQLPEYGLAFFVFCCLFQSAWADEILKPYSTGIFYEIAKFIFSFKIGLAAAHQIIEQVYVWLCQFQLSKDLNQNRKFAVFTLWGQGLLITALTGYFMLHSEVFCRIVLAGVVLFGSSALVCLFKDKWRNKTL